MPTGPVLLAFTLSALLVLLVPGPAIAYLVTRGLEGGRSAGLSAAVGVSTGAFIHAVGATTGLAAVLASTQWAFTAIQLAGAGYLVYLGIQQFRTCRTHPGRTGRRRAPISTGRMFVDGLVINVLNPKTVLFFLAFLPQFVDPALGPATTQLMVFALCFVPIAYLVNGTCGLLAARLGNGIGNTPRIRARIGRGTGAVYLVLAAVTLVA